MELTAYFLLKPVRVHVVITKVNLFLSGYNNLEIDVTLFVHLLQYVFTFFNL